MMSRDVAGSWPPAYIPFVEEQAFSPVDLRIWYDMNYIFLKYLVNMKDRH